MQASNDAVSIVQDTYGRWFVEAMTNGRKRAPIRCMSKQEAEEWAERMRMQSVRLVERLAA